MRTSEEDGKVLRTTAGDFLLREYRLRLAGREWSILHVGSVLSREDESRFLDELKVRLPYGVALWPAAIALAHDVASRAEELKGSRVLELGAVACDAEQVERGRGSATAPHRRLRTGRPKSIPT